MKIMMVAGGSGGHIYPALSLAKALKEKGHEISFIGSNDRMEKEVIPSHNFHYIGLDIYTTKGSILQKIKSSYSIIKAYFKVQTFLKGYDIVIGFGNYISVPVIMAAKKLKIKTIIHEQNSYVGRANLFLDKKVDLVIGSYQENLKQFKNKNIKILGNPQSSIAAKIKSDKKIISDMGLDTNKKTILIFMGSLGSSSVNQVIVKMLKKVDDSFNIIYATGKRLYEDVLKENLEKENVKIFESVDGIKVMKQADLLVSRAGATTIAEITAIQIPAILIPSPYVPNNHQYYNALALTSIDGAEMIEEKDLNEDVLFDNIKKLVVDDKRLKMMKENLKQLANPNVLDDIVNEVEKLC